MRLPSARATLDFFPPPDFEATTIEDFMTIGHIITAVPALNAIPAVISAHPGIVSYSAYLFPMPRGWVRLT
jgi:2,4-diaminopentanoate dehydrogenase